MVFFSVIFVSQLSIDFHPCHSMQQPTGNSFSVVTKDSVKQQNYTIIFGIQLTRRPLLAF